MEKGATEAFVKKMKRTLHHTYRDKKLTIPEFNSALKRIASILNSRPVCAGYGSRGGGDPEFLFSITPNMLLTG